MADEKKHVKKKRRPHKIITTEAADGSFGHEHIYHGDERPVFAGTSQHVEDAKQHLQDHFGKGEEEAEAGEPGEAAGEQPEAEA